MFFFPLDGSSDFARMDYDLAARKWSVPTRQETESKPVGGSLGRRKRLVTRRDEQVAVGRPPTVAATPCGHVRGPLPPACSGPRVRRTKK